MMELRDYLHFNRITITDFAKMINYGRIYTGEISSGAKRPGRKIIGIIYEKTNLFICFL